MPTGPATIPSLTAHVCICLYFRFPSASLTSAYECFRLPRLRVQPPSPCHCVHSHLHHILVYTRCSNFNSSRRIILQQQFLPFFFLFYTTNGKERFYLPRLNRLIIIVQFANLPTAKEKKHHNVLPISLVQDPK